MRKIAKELAELGHVNVNGRPYSATCIVDPFCFPLWLLTMPRKRTRRLFGTFVALVIMLAGGVLIYSGWQSKPGREEVLALGIGMTIGGLILVVWFRR